MGGPGRRGRIVLLASAGLVVVLLLLLLRHASVCGVYEVVNGGKGGSGTRLALRVGHNK